MRAALGGWLAAAGLVLSLGALAQGGQAGGSSGADRDVRRMIESLRGAAPAAPASASTARTRNLVIEATPAPEPSAATGTRPSTAATTPVPLPAAAPTAATPAAPALAPAPQGLSLAIGFEPNSAQLRPESGATLGALVAAMLSPELRQNRFVIEGHTDAQGSAAQNMRLSRERAEQVRLYLVTLGVAGERLRAVGKGATEPANAQDPRSPENRRVRVVALP